MGADLYIRSLPDEGRRGGFEVSEEAVKSGYFRDSYNGWGLFAIMSATLGETISWWEISDGHKDWFNSEDDREENGLVMTSEGCKKFWTWMQPKIIDFIGRKKLYRSNYLGDGKYENILIALSHDRRNVKKHAELFMKFYRYANELGSPIRWSV